MNTQTIKAYSPEEVKVTEVPSSVVYLVVLAGVVLLAVGMVIVAGM